MHGLTWNETRRRLEADHRRLLEVLESAGGSARRSAWLHPSFVCVFLYRVANYFHRAGWPRVARIFWQANCLATGSDINERADLGEGLVVMVPAGTALMGTAGRNLTVMACAGIGGEVGRREDVGAGPGLALLGDDVVLEPHSGVLGPVRVGNRVRVCAGIALTRDAQDDTLVSAPPPRFLPRRDPH